MTNENERNRYIGLMGACIGMGFIVGPAIGGMLSHFGNAVPFQIASNLLLILFLYTCFTFKESLNNAEEKHAENPLKNSFVYQLHQLDYFSLPSQFLWH